MAIVRIKDREYLEGENAVADHKIIFFGIPLIRSTRHTTNTNIIKSLGGIPKSKQCMTIVKGFSYEDKDKETK